MPGHRVEIDQSNKIEDSGDTYLACANGFTVVIRVPFRVKKAGIHFLRQRGKSKKTATLMLFAACVYLLLEKQWEHLSMIIVDNEYDGRQVDIRSFLLEYLKKQGRYIAPQKIAVHSVGKQSPAHEAAWGAFRGKQQVDRTITVRQLLAVLQ